MRLYFGGAEIGSHRTLLEEEGVRNVALSYMGLRRRVKFVRPWLIKDKFSSYQSVFLDSGAYTVNTSEDITTEEIEEVYEAYVDFVNQNLDDVDMVSEFDAVPMGMDWIEEQRDVFWSKIPPEKFMAIWHPVWGVQYLNEMASRFEIIGIPETSMDGRNLRPVLNALAAKGVKIHGVAMTKGDELMDIRWHSVASTSWISPAQYGDTIVWTGNQLKRYPRKYKDQARRRHRRLFTEMDLDAEKIAADDPKEVLRLSVRSWLKVEEQVNRRHKTGNTDAVVTPLFSHSDKPNAETPEDGVDTASEDADNNVSTMPVSKEVTKRRTPSTLLPVMSIIRSDEEDDDSAPLVNIRSESARVCNTCFLADKCPMYEPDSNCAYNIPITIKTREQRKALHEGLIEMQTQRVMFMRFAEETEGGYADPNLTKELAVLNKMLKEFADMESQGFSMRLDVRGPSDSAQAGFISRVFGRDAGQTAGALETGPVDADSYIDAEIIKDSDDES